MADVIVYDKNFEYAHATLVTDLAALLAPNWFHHLRFVELPRFNSQRTQLCLSQFSWFFAFVTQAPNEPLRHDRAYRGGDKEPLNADVNQTSDGGGGVVGVQRTENKMSGQARVRCNARSLEVANFPDHNDVRRLAQDRA